MSSDRSPEGTEAPQRTSPERLLESLLSTLLERTREGVLPWEIDEAQVDSYCIARDGWLIASRSVDGDGAEPYALVVAEASGDPILELRSSRAYARPYREMFGQLHSAAAATAAIAEAEPTLTAILGELGARKTGRRKANRNDRRAAKGAPT